MVIASSSAASASASCMMITAPQVRAVASAVRENMMPGPAEPAADEDNGKVLRFVAISLLEEEPLAVDSTLLAEAIVLNPSTGIASELVVALDESQEGTTIAKVVRRTDLPPGRQPMFTPDDCDWAESIVQQSSVVQAALLERYGIDDMTLVACDPWSVHLAGGGMDDDELTGWRKNEDGSNIPARLIQTFLYLRQNGTGLQDNHYACPIDLLPVVDLNAGVVVTIVGLDRSPPLPVLPKQSVNYHRDLISTNTYLPTSWRADVLKALNVVQPDGPSFRVDPCTNRVEWQKWSFQVGFNYREGVVLHNVAFENRSVVRRMSLVEMAVPYADPNPPFQRKCAFDVGDYGLGYCANSLELGCDCLGHIHYFDAVLVNSKGEPVTKKKAVCMHEEDGGILWKHVEYRNGHNESRRSRELVVSFIATVVNYEYLFYWRFKMDGTIDYEIKLSGELSTNLPSPGEDPSNPSHGVLVAPSVNAQIHQHMFCARIDVAVDGPDNVVSEVDIVTKPPDKVTNPFGNAFVPVATRLESELGAIRTADPSKARFWKVQSASKTNPINGKPTGYKLVPFTKGPAQPVLMVDASSSVARKGKFATANLWVTPYDKDQRFPAGNYTPQGDGSVGLPDWTTQDRSLVDCKDGLVVWHAFGVCHVPRIEDFPVMPVEVTGFTLKPDNFFVGNPAVDVPPEVNAASRLAASPTAAVAQAGARAEATWTAARRRRRDDLLDCLPLAAGGAAF